jgi:hypothetical protein
MVEPERSTNHLIEMKPLLDRANSIKSEEIRLFTKQMILYTPISNWQQRASRNHHLPDERVEWGTRLHTCRVHDCWTFIASVFQYEDILTDIGKSAALLHDCRKYGMNGTYDYTVPQHPFLVRKVMDELEIKNTSYRECVLTCVEAHMGQWTEKDHKPAPIQWGSLGILETPARMIHLSDCVVARFAEVIGKEPLNKE